MKGIFISYRRDDSAGHAGRLFDGLKEHFGADHVFMDVSDLRPGQDFTVELERALARSDYLLAVIGPRWLDAVDAKGRRRLDHPDDFVRREVSVALASRATVIPVLVHGARMPPAESLPEELQPLARRQAIELTDQRWDGDLRELVECLAEDASASKAAPTAPPATRAGSSAAKPAVAASIAPPRAGGIGPGSIVILVLGLAVAGAGVWLLLRPDTKRPEVAVADGTRADARAGKRDQETRAAREDAARDVPSTAAVSGTRDPEGKPGVAARSAAVVAQRDAVGTDARASGEPQAAGAGSPAFSIARPEVSEVKFRTNRAVVSFSILGIRLEPRDAETQVLTFLVRMLNQGPLDEAFGSDQFRLVSGEQSIKPENDVIGSTEAVSAKDVPFRFIAPANLAEPALEVRVNAESTRIPISLAARTPIPADGSVDSFARPKRPRLVDTIKPLPATLPAGQRVQVGKVEYQIVDATLERDTVEKASLTLTVRCSVPRNGVAANFWSSSVRLWIDGVPRAPVNDVNEIVDAGDSKDARFVFEIVSMPQGLEVGLNHSGDRVRVPLRLAAVAKQ